MPAFSLNCVMRFSQPMRATQLKTQASSACSATWLWLKTICCVGVDAGGDKGRRHFPDARLQLLRILRHRDRMQIDDAIEAIVRPLQFDESA